MSNQGKKFFAKCKVNKSVTEWNRYFSILFGLGLLIGLLSCKEPPKSISGSSMHFLPKPHPNSYVCYRASSPIKPDGILDEKEWSEVPWTENFQDIFGSSKPAAHLKTHIKLLWDDTNLYVAAELEEPHVWATLRQRDTVMFFDNDFEMFIDPDGDTHDYYELEVNAFGNPWDLLLLKPYRDGGPGPYVTGWDIAGLKVGVHVDGTINNPGDKDKGWSVELVLPLSALRECIPGRVMPKAGDQWRINSYRAEWRTLIENGKYKKEIDPKTGNSFPCYAWVWTPQGANEIHMPEMWGYLQFSSIVAGGGTEAFVPDKDFDLKWALRLVYYAEYEYFGKHETYSSKLSEIGLSESDFPKNLSLPVISATRTTFECSVPDSKQKQGWIIYQDGKIIYQ